MPKRETVLYKIRTGDLCEIKGISKWSLRQEIASGRLCLRSLEDIIRWANEPRTRGNKGKPLIWLNKGELS